ncbi:MAG: hypothetical protein JWM34_120 [Ilumatobacteraceae bacterium]|nr:hypothetical protein [Ilumatobacteraceae bacterium]
MTEPARVLHATLDLLDRQLVDRDGVLCGNVDDLEITRPAETAELFVTALLAGPGILAYRMGARRFGRWLQRSNAKIHGDPVGEPTVDAVHDRTRIPIELAYQIGPSIRIAMSADDLASHDGERWAMRHAVEHIPGNDSRAPQ